MRKTAVWLVTLLLLCGVAAAEEIGPDELQALIETNATLNLFDLRSEEAYEQGTLPGASLIPLTELRGTIQAALDDGFNEMDVPLYMYGETAEDGRQAESILRELGFTNVHYLASVHDWTGGLLLPNQLLGSLKTEDIYGNKTDMSLIAGKKLVMVNVWATYCNPCLSEMGALGRIAADLAEDGVMILGLVTDCSNPDLTADQKQTELARTIAEQTGAVYPHLLPSREMYQTVLPGISAVPTTFFLDGRGQWVGEVYVGARAESEWRQIIADTLAGMERTE